MAFDSWHQRPQRISADSWHKSQLRQPFSKWHEYVSINFTLVLSRFGLDAYVHIWYLLQHLLLAADALTVQTDKSAFVSQWKGVTPG